MNFEQEIHNQNNARRMNILKGFSDFSEDLLQKSEDSSELEKGHMDFSNQRVYADNSVNRKLNRVGQKYGGRNVEDEKVVYKKDNSEEEGDGNKPAPPQETQPNEQGQYSTEQLTEFAAQAEDWQLQEFLDNAKKSGDNSEYMQAQVNIAETELNRRRGGETSREENVDSNNEKNFEQQESDYQENMSNVDENGLPDFNDIEAVKNFLNENPQIKDRALAIVNDDIFIPMKDAIKLANAETKSSGEAMRTVEAAKQALDEVYNKLGGNSSMNELDMSKYSPEDIKGMSNADLQSLFEEYTGGDPEDYSRSEMEEELIGRIEAENPNVENKNGPANPSLHFSEMSDDELEDMYADDNFNSMEEQVAAEEELYKRGILSGKEYDEAYGKHKDDDSDALMNYIKGSDDKTLIGYSKQDGLMSDYAKKELERRKSEGIIKEDNDNDEPLDDDFRTSDEPNDWDDEISPKRKNKENPSTSPAGEPNRAEQPTKENSDLEQEDNKDGILQEMDAEFGHLEGNWEKANPKTYDTSDMPNLMSYEGSKKMYDADLQLFYNPDNSTYIVENYANGNSEEFSSEEDVNNFINEALDNIGELNDNRNR